MKKRIWPYFLAACVLLAGCSGEPAGSLPEHPDGENPFSSEGIVDEQISYSYGFGVSNPPLEKDMVYDGSPVSVEYSIENSGPAMSTGMLLFVNGEPQPYCVGDSQTPVYMHIQQAPAKQQTNVTVSFVPVCGKAGDVLHVRFSSLLNPQNKPTSLSYTFGHSNAMTTFLPRKLEMKAAGVSAVPTAKEPLPRRRLTEEELKKMRYTDSRGMQIDRMAQFQVQITNPEAPDQEYLDCRNQQLTYKIQAYGGVNAEYRLIPYINHEPVWQNSIPGVVSIEEGDFMYESTVHIDVAALDKSRYHIGTYNVFYLMAVPTRESGSEFSEMSRSFVFKGEET